MSAGQIVLRAGALIGSLCNLASNREKLMDERDARRKLETTIAQRRDKFALNHLTITQNGYILKFRQGIVDIVRTRVACAVLDDAEKLASLLDEIHRDFRRLNPGNRTAPGN